MIGSVAGASGKRKAIRALLLSLLLAVTLLALPACSEGEDTGTGARREVVSQEAEPQGEEEPAEENPPAEERESAEPEDAPAEEQQPSTESEDAPASAVFDLSQVPAYSGSPYATINGNVPSLSEADAPAQSESYSPLDHLGRCGTAIAVVSPSTMPAEGEERGSIGMVKPSGWHTVRYDDLVDGRYLYNRCHLIGWQLTAENANERNLITGTRYMNVEGMLPFENEVADYVERTGGRVLYRSTPIFQGDEPLCRGVHLEALSLDDGGLGVAFNVFCYNVQLGVGIDYATGDSWRERSAAPQEQSAPEQSEQMTYILNTNTHKFHYPECRSVDQMSEKNKREFTGSRDEAIAQGYEPCGNCNP